MAQKKIWSRLQAQKFNEENFDHVIGDDIRKSEKDIQ